MSIWWVTSADLHKYSSHLVYIIFVMAWLHKDLFYKKKPLSILAQDQAFTFTKT